MSGLDVGFLTLLGDLVQGGVLLFSSVPGARPSPEISLHLHFSAFPSPSPAYFLPGHLVLQSLAPG